MSAWLFIPGAVLLMLLVLYFTLSIIFWVAGARGD